MDQLSYRRHRFPPAVIQHAIWLYLRFTLSYRDVEELLAERGLEVSYETVRRWGLKFGPGFSRRLRRSRPRPSDRGHLDEMVVPIAGKRMYLWRAVDHEDGGLIPGDRTQPSLGFRRAYGDEAPVLHVEGCRRGGGDSHQHADLVVAQGDGRVVILGGAAAYDRFDDGVGHGDFGHGDSYG